MIHQPDGSTPSAPGSEVQRTTAQQIGRLLEEPQDERAQHADDERGNRQRQKRRGVTFGSVSGVARLIFGEPFVVPALAGLG